MMLPLIGTPGVPEILLILLVVVLLFGAKKLPELARGSGRALRIFKAETKGLMDDDDEDDDQEEPRAARDRRRRDPRGRAARAPARSTTAPPPAEPSTRTHGTDGSRRALPRPPAPRAR